MSKTPWLELAKAEVGVREVAGKADNPKILAFYAEAGHPGIEHDETPWCAAFVGAMLQRAGYPSTGALDARSYLKYGRDIAKPQPGCIVVFWRNSPASWEGHVAFYIDAPGDKVRVLGGNQVNAVNVTAYPRSQVLGYRMPIAPTVRNLRAAGSSEVAQADRLQKGAAATAGSLIAAEAVDKVLAPVVTPPVIPKVDPSLINASEYLTVTQKLVEGARVVANLVISSRSGLIVAGCIAVIAVCWWWKRRRVDKHKSGVPVGVGQGGADAVA